MSMTAVLERVVGLVDTYGEEVTARVLELAPLVAGSGGAWEFAVEAMQHGDDGTLVVRIPGLPGEPPRVTWMGSGWHVTAAPVERSDGHQHDLNSRHRP